MAKSLSVTINGKEYVSSEAKKAEDSLHTLKSTTETVTHAMKVGAEAAAVAFAGITTAIGAVTAATVKSAEMGDNIDKMSQKIGMSRESFQEWEFILSQSGMEIDKLQTSMKTLSDAAMEASLGSETYSRTFDALGVSVTDANGALKSQEVLFNEAIVALTEIESTTERAAYASDLFGRSATELAPLLNSGTGAIEGMRLQAHELGLILSDETVDASVLLTDTIDQLKRSFSALSVDALAPMMPLLTELSTSLMGVMQGDSGSSDNMANALIEMINTALDSIVQMVPQVADIGSQVVLSLVEGIVGDLPQIADTAIDIVMSLIDTIIQNLPMLMGAAVDIIITLAEGIVDAVPQLVERIPEIVEALLVGFAENAPKLIMSGIELMLELAEGLIKSIPTILTYLPQIVTSMVNGFKESIPKFLQMGKDVIDGLVQGIKDFANKPVEAVKDVGGRIVDGFKDFFGIHSPSRVFAEFGEYFMEGLAIGIQDNEGLVSDALKGAGIVPDGSMDVNVTASGGSQSGAGIDIMGMLGSGMGQFITSLSSVQAILDPITTILGGAMEVLGPVIDQVLSPLVGILKIVGRLLGAILTPAIEMLMPPIQRLSEVFVWLYNTVLVPVGNGIITAFNMVFNGIAFIYNGIAKAVNSALGWAGVNMKSIDYKSAEAGHLSKIDVATLTEAGSTSGSSYTGGGAGSSTSVQSVNITVYQTFQGHVIGDGGLESVGEFVVQAIQAYAGVGGTVKVIA